MARPDLRAYLPEFLVRELSRHPVHALPGRTVAFEGIALFADVVGFTALSESFARSGKAGAEALTEILNRHFELLIALIQQHGGDVVRFGGDAIIAAFRCTSHNHQSVGRSAVRCAWAMQTAIREREAFPTSIGSDRLTMKVGLAYGAVHCTVVGDERSRLDYVVAGGAIRSVINAAHHAAGGEVIVDGSLEPWLREWAKLSERDGFYAIEPHGKETRPARRPRRVRAQPMLTADLAATLARFVHPTIKQWLDGSLGDLANEHRKVTALFARHASLDFGDVVRILDTFGGHLARVDVDEVSVRSFITFGAPVAHEDDEARALRAALEIAALSPGATHIGVNTGFAFCANVGSNARREYTVMGDAVNLSERLMRAAQPGQIVVGEATRRAVGDQFAWQALGPIAVKGRAEPVLAFALQGLATSPTKTATARPAGGPLVGREVELSQVAHALERASRGAGQVIAISGEAGMGKTRLASEVARLAIDHGFEVHIGACDAYATNASYAVWQPIWRGLFDVDASLSTAEQARHLQVQLAAIHPELAERSALLGPVLGVSLPEPEWVTSLDPKGRADALRFLLFDCLRHWASERPLLLILEDCHWMDPPSHELLVFLASNASDLPVACLVLYRGAGDERNPMHKLSLLTHIRLTALDAAQSAQVAYEVWRNRCSGSTEAAPPAALLSAIVEKAQGNPLYIEGLVHFVCERAPPSQPPPSEGWEVGLPDTLRSLILSRIDHLQSDEQAVLKVASVIGREFDASWLHECLPSTELSTAAQGLAKLCQLDLLQPASAAGDDAEAKYTFKHGLIQEVAYDSLAFANRSLLHERVGAFIEQRYANDLPQFFDALAFHFGRTPNVAKQRIYFRKAGDAAKAAYANAAAIDYYLRLLPLLHEAEQVEALLNLGSVLQLIGKWDEAETHFQQALTIANEIGDAHAQAESQRAIGELYLRHRSHGEATSWLEQAGQTYERLGDDVGLSRTLRHLSYAYFEQGQRERAHQLSTQHLEIAVRADDLIGMSDALHNLGQVYAQEGDLEAAQSHFARALEIATQANYKLRVIHVANDVARLHWQRGDYGPAMLNLMEAMRIAREIGYQSSVGVMAGNLGMVYWEVGDFVKARECCARALDIALEVGDAPAILTCLDNLGLILRDAREDALAERVFRRAIVLGRESNQPYLLCEPLFATAHLHLQRGEYATAAMLNAEATALAIQVNDEELHLKSKLLDIRLRWLTGTSTYSDAASALAYLLDTSVEDHERAAVGYTWWQLDPAREDIRRAAADLYAGLYDRVPKHEYRLRYAELAGVPLPEFTALPPLPSEWIGSSNDLDALLFRAGVT